MRTQRSLSVLMNRPPRRVCFGFLVAMSIACLAHAGPASAAFTRSYSGDSFGPQGLNGNGEPEGMFSEPQSIAVEQSSGDVFVYDVGEGGRVYKFNAAGEPEEFSSSSTNVIEGVGGGASESQIAVDSSSGPDAGDIYVDTGKEVAVYGSSGVKLGTLTAEGEPCGVAVDPSGDVYVAVYDEEAVKQYNPLIEPNKPVSEGDYESSLTGLGHVCSIAADSAGDIYAAPYGGGVVTKYEASQFNTLGAEATGTPIDAEGASLAVDPTSGGDVYIDEESDIAEYTPSGTLITSFGELSESYGVAVDHTSDQIYADDDGVVEIFGPPVVVPDVSTEAVSDEKPESVRLNGSVDPEETSVTACEFEYGTEATYGQNAPCSPSAPFSGGSAVPVTAELFGLEANTIYHYRLDVKDEDGAISRSADQTFTTPPGPPLPGVPTSSEVTPFGVTLSDTLNPENPPTGTTSYYFEYGPTSAYGQRFPVEGDAGDGSTAIAVTQAIAGLTPGTTYHYALVATNSAGTTITTTDQTFTTLPASAPTVSTGAAGGVTQYEATLSGALDPQGLQTSYHFDIGADTSYGTQVFGPTVISPSTVTLGLQDLQPGTTYHYRLTATNSAGTTYGADQTFTTAGVAPVITQPLTPPLLATPNIAFPTEPKTTKPKVLTNAQKLAAALKACKKKPKNKHAGCQKQARKRYGSAKKKKGKMK